MPRLLSLLFCILAWTSPALSAQESITEGFINAPLAEVWRLFTTADGLRRAGAAQAEIDLKIGGILRTQQDLNGKLGNENTMTQRILAFDPERMLALRIEQAPADLPGREALGDVWTVMYFSAAGEAMTHIRIVELGHDDDPASQVLREHLDSSHREMLARLAKPYWPACALCKAPSPESDNL